MIDGNKINMTSLLAVAAAAISIGGIVYALGSWPPKIESNTKAVEKNSIILEKKLDKSDFAQWRKEDNVRLEKQFDRVLDSIEQIREDLAKPRRK